MQRLEISGAVKWSLAVKGLTGYVLFLRIKRILQKMHTKRLKYPFWRPQHFLFRQKSRERTCHSVASSAVFRTRSRTTLWRVHLTAV